MSYVEINGGKKLRGTIVNQSAKNSAVAIMCAAAMIKSEVNLSAVPEIEEVRRIAELLNSIGIVAKKTGMGKWMINASGKIDLKQADVSAIHATRSSMMLIGALASRVVEYDFAKSGGCKLGERSVRPHLFALKQLGINITETENHYHVVNKKLRGTEIVMYEAGDTATENTIMAAVMAPGRTIIRIASANYMVQDLCYFLKKAGAKIQGIGTNTLVIDGVKTLKKITDYPIMPDPIIAMTFIASAIVTKSRLTIANCPLDFLRMELYKLEIMGQKMKVKNKRRSKNGNFEIVDIEIIPSELISLPDKVESQLYPGMNIDNLPLFVPILASATGKTLVHDWAYENRAVLSLELQKLGAKITMLDPHRVLVEGPTKFVPNEVICPPAIRTAIIILIAMLAAKGRSILRNTYPIDRGYENIYNVLNQIGADVAIIND